ncbi:hypothetical protein K2173_010239 [Erythroxylum novogranatense]|uniref:Uncharacterized protein n=1 Tax=Erythroxylum novogranatense TaxID=1862640 RepID=A0AAV8UC97_9ROSI|nr:hypothetical protein K2173_010239 [Erythroxylum novogranatense]
MGNYTSSCIPIYSGTRTAKLMDTEGRLRRVKLPIKAAELMLQDPGNLISPANELLRVTRVIAMRAEDDLRPGQLYLLFPLSRVRSKVSGAEMELIVSASEKRSSNKQKGAKVLPVVSVDKAQEGDSSDVEDVVGANAGFLGHRTGNCRRWTPVLETISEEV